MITYKIDGKYIEFDETQTYLDFCINHNNQPQLSQISLDKMLGAIENGSIKVDNNLKEYMDYLQRWKDEAPRRRHYREMKLRGFTVVSTDYFFEQDGGEEIIDHLENTGVFADYFMEKIFGKSDNDLSLIERRNLAKRSDPR